jgi:hypothetical protein
MTKFRPRNSSRCCGPENSAFGFGKNRNGCARVAHARPDGRWSPGRASAGAIAGRSPPEVVDEPRRQFRCSVAFTKSAAVLRANWLKPRGRDIRRPRGTPARGGRWRAGRTASPSISRHEAVIGTGDVGRLGSRRLSDACRAGDACRLSARSGDIPLAADASICGVRRHRQNRRPLPGSRGRGEGANGAEQCSNSKSLSAILSRNQTKWGG